MLKTITHMKGFSIRATDGEIGTVEQLYFDDQTWTVRYLTVATGGWLENQKVLISPFSIKQVNWQARRIDVSLSKDQVKNSPDIDTHKPVSRQHESSYLTYYGYPNYWNGPFSWGPSYYPGGYAAALPVAAELGAARPLTVEAKDSHLRSTGGISGYDIQAIDGEIGHVSSFVLEEETWAIRYIEVATRNWWPGKKVLLSPDWVQRVSWLSLKVYVALTRESIQTAPAYVDSLTISRQYEELLHAHYGRPPYWLNEPHPTEVLLSTGAL